MGGRTLMSILGRVGRVRGLGFGALKGLIGATLVFMLASLLYDTVYGGGAKRPEWMTTSRSYPLLNASGKAISEFVAERRALPAARHDQGMNAPLYNRDILRLAASIPYHRRLTDEQASVEKRSETCGSSVTVDVCLDNEGRVANLGLEVRACALGQASARSEEHTSELQSLMRISYAVFCLK